MFTGTLSLASQKLPSMPKISAEKKHEWVQ